MKAKQKRNKLKVSATVLGTENNDFSAVFFLVPEHGRWQSIDFPSIVYMIVDKKIELETKFLRDYPEWEFLPNEDLDRECIELYNDLKTAKRLCNKEQ